MVIIISLKSLLISFNVIDVDHRTPENTIEITEVNIEENEEENEELDPIEKESLAAGIERICLELSARFCADAVNNSYFKEDRQNYPEVGRHNLTRAEAQFALAQSVNQHRKQCEQIIKE